MLVKSNEFERKNAMKSKRKVIQCQAGGLRHVGGACPPSYRATSNSTIGLNRLLSTLAGVTDL